MRRRVYSQYSIDVIHKDLFYWCASVAEVVCPPDATELSAFDRGCEISWTCNSELRSHIFQGPFANPSRHESQRDCMILKKNLGDSGILQFLLPLLSVTWGKNDQNSNET